MKGVHFVKPRGLVEFEASPVDSAKLQDDPDYFAGLLSRPEFADAVVGDISSMAVIMREWLVTPDGHYIDPIKLGHTEKTTELTLPKGFYRADERNTPAESIIMPLHATTALLASQRESGTFACAGLVTVELTELYEGTPELLQTIITRAWGPRERL